jgi:hypothetical protein
LLAIFHTYQSSITTIVTDNEKIFLGDDDGQVVEIDLSQKMVPDVPTKLVVTSEGEINSETLGRQFMYKQKNSNKNMKKDFKVMPRVLLVIYVLGIQAYRTVDFRVIGRIPGHVSISR